MKNLATSQPLSLPPSRPVALKFGVYRPCLEIGSGGMAAVYIAREVGESGLQRTVALKVMHEHLARTERYKKRFLDEARILSRLAHPYICSVFGYGEDEGRPFMAMEYLVGEPLSRVLRAMKRRVTSLSCADRARLFGRVIADIAEGIHAAHETRDGQGRMLGVVHRDVSPQNLFMLYDGTVRILDFGIAWYRDRYVQTATTSRLIGKLPYMAPEQIQGLPYDRRVDVWALGIVLWELVTLDRLFRRETEVRTMEAVCSEPIPLASEVAEGVPPGFDQILARALERDPEKRYQTARELAHDLEVWLATTGQPVTHADLSRVLNDFFPGSENERRRWAEAPDPHASSTLQIPQIDFSSESVSSAKPSLPSLSLPPRLLREEDLVSAEVTPPPQPVRGDARDNVNQEHKPMPTPYDVEHPEPISASPQTNASPVAISVREPAAQHGNDTGARRGWWIGGAAIGLTAGLLIGFAYLGRSHSASVASYGAAPAAQGAYPDVAYQRAPGVPPGQVGDSVRAPFAADVNAGRGVTEPVQPTVAGKPTDKVLALDDEVDESARDSRDEGSKAMLPSGASRRVAPKADVTPRSDSASRADSTYITNDLPALGTGDVLVVSATPGLKVYLGDKFIGQTPVRTRLPVGVAQLSVQVSAEGPRTPVKANVAAGRLNIVSLK